MKTKLGFIILGLVLTGTIACTKYPPSADRLLEDLAVITQYDTKIDFNDYKTYSIAPSIVKITDKDTTEITNQTAQDILNQIDKNMQERGFVKVAKGSEQPDFGIQVIYFQNTYIYTYYYNWWGYYPYWYYYYPYYPVYY